MNYLHKADIPNNLEISSVVAVDTETMGLNYQRDRLCLIQASFGDKNVHLIKFDNKEDYKRAKNIKLLMRNKKVLKVFHYARFDLAMIKKHLGVMPSPIYCTKIASKLARTYTDKHGLKEICKELINIEMSKQQQSSDWGKIELSKNQMNYAANDVLYLHDLKDKLDAILKREDRIELAYSIFKFLPTRVKLDLMGWANTDIFSHS